MSNEPHEKILMVDDDALVTEVIGAVLRSNGFRFESASDGVEGLLKARDLHPDLIFLDISMPGMDGFQTCRRLREDPVTRKIPVVMLTADTDRESRIKALEAGANDFLTKPVDNTELVVRANNLLKTKRYQDSLEEQGRILEQQVQERTRQLMESLLETVQRLTLASEYRDVDSYVHVKRISYYTEVVVKSLGISGEEAEIMVYASPMHDIGKVGIPDAILLKPGVLTDEEFEIMKTHTTIGARILRGSGSPYLRSAEQFALYHHERWDGNGYPQGLKGEAIPIEGRIMNLIDQYDALRSKRPYKPPFDHERAVAILTGGGHRTNPGHFDPWILQIFKDSTEKFREIFETHQSW
jgi:putative two-component system response regulator